MPPQLPTRVQGIRFPTNAKDLPSLEVEVRAG